MIPALIICAIIEGLKLSEFDNDPKQMTCYVDYYAQIGIIITFVIYVVPLIVTFHFLSFFSNQKQNLNLKRKMILFSKIKY